MPAAEVPAQMSFDRAFPIVVNVEGGDKVSTDEGGGLTKYGISQHAFPKLDIRALTLDDAKDIYLRDYWQAAGCGGMTWPLCLYVFDAAVNQGVEAAVKLLEKTLARPQNGVLCRDDLVALAMADPANTAGL